MAFEGNCGHRQAEAKKSARNEEYAQAVVILRLKRELEALYSGQIIIFSPATEMEHWRWLTSEHDRPAARFENAKGSRAQVRVWNCSAAFKNIKSI